MPTSRAKSKCMCSGCHNDYYNQDRYGGCCNFKKAKVVQRMRVGIWQNPPYHWSPVFTLSCCTPDGGVMISKDDPRVVARKRKSHADVT